MDLIDQIGDQVIKLIQTNELVQAVRLLRRNDLDEAADEIENPHPPFIRHEFVCPSSAVRVITPCRLRDCRFWVSNQMANNCLLAYCHLQQIDHLSADEIAYLYDQPVDHVNALLDDAMVRFRATAIQQDSQHDPEFQRVFWFVETAEVCCVCGSATDRNRLLVPNTPLAYCSRDCRDERSPDQIAIEYRLGRPIDTVIKWAIKRFRNLPLLERSLGLKRETTIQLVRRHLGRELQDYFPKLKLRDERPAWRRPISLSEQTQLLDQLARRTVRVVRRFGEPIHQIDNLRNRLHELVR
jgi:hypothetical protein